MLLTQLLGEPSDASREDLLRFGLSTAVTVIVAHAIAYMTHEYAHSFVAWALGWMADPLALDYGPASLNNILFLGDVGDNVPYDRIFAAGHGGEAAIIALAGVVIGNAGLYLLLDRASTRPWFAATAIGRSSLFLLSLMCAGNVWSYVPVRAITTHSDMALAARGIGISPWVQLPLVAIPALYLAYHFLARTCPRAIPAIAAGSSAKAVLLVALTSYWFFVFFVGDAAAGHYGLVSQLIAIVSKYVLFPLSAVWLWRRVAVAETG